MRYAPVPRYARNPPRNNLGLLSGSARHPFGSASLVVTLDVVRGGWVVTSIERTAYPPFKRLITAHELHLFFAPSRDEVEWAAARADCDEHLLAQLLALKPYQRMGCFPKLDEIPDKVVDFVRRAVDLPEGTVPRAVNRTAERQRTAVRQRTGLSYDKAKARKIAEAVMRSEAGRDRAPAPGGGPRRRPRGPGPHLAVPD
ncbi:DUF4158 domain-containing protein [Streptomyces sp. NPDC005407]|uniref:DUF4158 domain-containing protein n=1 Tax=Streptomyces sp. NPDC005407 TaxID=3155340 RepID=UPI0033BF49C0